MTESDPLYARPDIRMTLDYEADYRFFVAVVDALNARGLPPSFAAIMQHIAAHPDLVAINADAQQAYAAHLRASEPATLGSGPRR